MLLIDCSCGDCGALITAITDHASTEWLLARGRVHVVQACHHDCLKSLRCLLSSTREPDAPRRLGIDACKDTYDVSEVDEGGGCSAVMISERASAT